LGFFRCEFAGLTRKSPEHLAQFLEEIQDHQASIQPAPATPSTVKISVRAMFGLHFSSVFFIGLELSMES